MATAAFAPTASNRSRQQSASTASVGGRTVSGPAGTSFQTLDPLALQQAVESQALRNALLGVGLEQRIDPNLARARAVGQAQLANLAAGVSPNQIQAQGIINRALAPQQAPTAQAAQMGVAPTIQAALANAASLGSAPQIGNIQGISPALAQAAQMANAERIAAAQMGNAPLISAAQMGGTPNISAAQIAAGSLPQVGQVNLGNAAQVRAGTMGGPTSIDGARVAVTDLQRALDALNLADVRLGGQLDPEVRNEVARAALGRAGTIGVAGGTARDVVARDLGLRSMDVRQQRLQNAENRAAAQQALNITQANLDQATAQFNAGLMSDRARMEYQAALQAGLSNAEAINRAAITQAQLNQQAQATNVANALNVAQQNAALMQQANLANQQAGLTVAERNAALAQQAALANQQAGLTVAERNAALAQQAALANQQAGLTVGERNAALAQQVNLANQDAAMRANLANQQSALQVALANLNVQADYGRTGAQFQQQTNLANQDAALRAALANQQAGLTVGERNAAFQQQTNLANQQAQESALSRQLQALGLAANTNQSQLGLMAGLAQQTALIPRPQVGLNPGDYASALISDLNNLNQFTAQGAAIGAQQQTMGGNQMGGGVASTRSASTRSGQNVTPIDPRTGLRVGQTTIPIGGIGSVQGGTTSFNVLPTAAQMAAQRQQYAAQQPARTALSNALVSVASPATFSGQINYSPTLSRTGGSTPPAPYYTKPRG